MQADLSQESALHEPVPVTGGPRPSSDSTRAKEYHCYLFLDSFVLIGARPATQFSPHRQLYGVQAIPLLVHKSIKVENLNTSEFFAAEIGSRRAAVQKV